KSVWTTMQCAVGRAGIGILSWPCGPMRYGRCYGQCSAPWGRHQKKPGPSPPRAAWRPSRLREDCCATECRGDAAPLLVPRAGHTAARGTHSGLVYMAPLASRHGQILARQAPRRFITTTVVLGRVDDLFDDHPCGHEMHECQKGLAQFLIPRGNAS